MQSIKEKADNLIDSVKFTGLRTFFNIYCKHLCNNKIKLWFVRDKPLRVGFPLMPYFCKNCTKFNPKAKDAYIKIKRWYPYG